jgi:hypothetical protein
VSITHLEVRQYDPNRAWLTETSVSHFVPPHHHPALYFKQTLGRDLVGRVRAQDIVAGTISYHDSYQHDGLGRLTVITSSDPSRNRTFKQRARRSNFQFQDGYHLLW